MDIIGTGAVVSGAREPSDIHRLFESFANAGDLDALVGLYDPEATLVPQPGQVVSTIESIRAALRELLALGMTFRLTTREVLVSGDLALTSNHWIGTDGEGQKLEGTTAEVLRRQADGRWLMAIDQPFFCLP